MAVEQADEFIKTGKTGQPEKQSIDCELVNKDNADKYACSPSSRPVHDDGGWAISRPPAIVVSA